MSTSPAASVIVTNYNTGAYLERCVASLVEQVIGGLPPEVIVVENASFVDQEPHLRAVAARGARVLRMPANLGHGAGCNRGLEHARGKVVFFANSDTRAGPGALAALCACLAADSGIAFVEPRTFFDDDFAFAIPELRPPAPGDGLTAALAAISPWFASRHSRRNALRSLRGWQATAPTAQRHLTGAFLGVRRAVIDRLGGYDEGYRLYYEDSDLFARAQRLGLRNVIVPAARVVHYTRRSVAQIWDEAMAKGSAGRARYMRTHHGRLAGAIDGALQQVAARCARRPPPLPPAAIDLGAVTAPPVLAGATTGPWLLEMALDPYWALTAGRVCATPEFTMSPATWQSLYPTTYFLRATRLDERRPLRAWRLIKVDSVATPVASSP